MKIQEIAFTLLPVSDLAQARAFYEELLGLKPTQVFEKEGMAFIEYDIGSGTLAIGSGVPVFKPAADGGAIALEVDDFEAAVEELKKRDIRFLMEPYETAVCRMATISDPDGNYIMIHHRKPQ